jgi:hypothetical protein
MEAASSSELLGSVRTTRIITSKIIFFTYSRTSNRPRPLHFKPIPIHQSSNHPMSYGLDANIVVKKATKERDKNKNFLKLYRTRRHITMFNRSHQENLILHMSPDHAFLPTFFQVVSFQIFRKNICYMSRPSHFLWFHHHPNIWQKQFMTVLIIQFSWASFHTYLLGTNILLNALFSNINLTTSLRARPKG